MMKLLAVVVFPEWRLRPANQRERRHWAVVKKMNTPPLPMEADERDERARVSGPHRQRLVEITRYGPRMLDTDGLYSSVKPALDRIKAGYCGGQVLPGYIWDDSPIYCRLEVKQERGPWRVEAKIWG